MAANRGNRTKKKVTNRARGKQDARKRMRKRRRIGQRRGMRGR